MIRWMDIRDIGLLVVVLGTVAWGLSGCSTPRAVSIYQNCLKCGVVVN